MKIKRLIQKLIWHEKANSIEYIRYLRKKGVNVGDNCTFHSVRTITIDVSQPTMIEIGNNVEFAGNTTVLCHDLAWSVFQKLTGEVLGWNKKTTIGNNVFIGIYSVIMGG